MAVCNITHCVCVCVKTAQSHSSTETQEAIKTQRVRWRSVVQAARQCWIYGRQSHHLLRQNAVVQVSLLPAFSLFLFSGHLQRWLGSQVVSVLDSGAEGPGFKSQSWRCRVTVLGKLFTPSSPSSKVGTALLRVARITAGLAENNGSLPPGLWLMLPARWLPRTGIGCGNPTLVNRVWATFTFTFTFLLIYSNFLLHEPQWLVSRSPGVKCLQKIGHLSLKHIAV